MAGTQNASWWQYSRYVYNIGRTWKMQDFSEAEREAIINFIATIFSTRPSLVPRINLKKGDVAEIMKQANYSLQKMVSLIGRDLKVLPLTDAEKTACDALFAVTDPRKEGVVGGFGPFVVKFIVTDGTAPVVGANVTFGTATGVTEADGSFTANGVVKGSYDLAITATGFQNYSEAGIAVNANVNKTITLTAAP